MYSRARKQLENSDEVHVHAFVLDVHFSRTTVRVRHVAVEHDVLAVAADRRAGRRPVAFGAPRAGLSQAIDRAPVHARRSAATASTSCSKSSQLPADGVWNLSLLL